MEACKNCNSGNVRVDDLYKYHDIFVCGDCGSWTFKRKLGCCYDPKQVVVTKPSSNGALFFMQCLNCGGSLNMTKAMKPSKTEKDFSEERFSNWKQGVLEESALIFKNKDLHDHKNSGYFKYLTYLMSDQWKEKQNSVLERDKELCRNCLKNKANCVLHSSFDNLYNEPLTDLESLCQDCGQARHLKMLGYFK